MTTDSALLSRRRSHSPIAYSASPLDRADAVRGDPARLAAVMAGEGARLLRLDGLAPVFSDTGGLVWVPLSDMPGGPQGAELIFLGLDAQGHGHFAPVVADLAGSTAPAAADLRRLLDAMPAADLAIYGGARSLVDWHARHRFCARVAARRGWPRAAGSAPASTRLAGPIIFRVSIPSRSCWSSMTGACCSGASRVFRPGAIRRWPGSSSRGRRWKRPSHARFSRKRACACAMCAMWRASPGHIPRR
jgi:hypothetical protein